MGIWLERFVLAVMAAIAGATILTNPWQLDRVQRISLVVVVAGAALFLARTFERSRETAQGQESTNSPAIVAPRPQEATLASPIEDTRPAGPIGRRTAPPMTGGPSPSGPAEPAARATAPTASQTINGSPGAIQAGRDVVIGGAADAEAAATANLKAALVRVLRFPDAVATAPGARSLLEDLLADQRPRKLFDVLIGADAAAIKALPSVGPDLSKYLDEYYAFSKMSTATQNVCLEYIGSVVSVRFVQAWRIYLRFSLLRFGGMSPDQIAAGGNFLNYDITWAEAERVYKQLAEDPSIAQKVSALLAEHRRLSAAAEAFEDAIKD